MFCQNPLSYVVHTDLKVKHNFNKVFVKKAMALLNKGGIAERSQNLLHSGYQTAGNLFDVESLLTGEMQQVIRSEIENYRRQFALSNEGFLRRWPEKYNLYSWIVRMKSGGRLDPHIHDKGWLSGTVYLNVPPKNSPDSGNFIVALGEDDDAIDSRHNSREIIDIDTGSMVLFPSSLTHSTVPFESEEDRIVLAFDVIPSAY